MKEISYHAFLYLALFQFLSGKNAGVIQGTFFLSPSLLMQQLPFFG